MKREYLLRGWGKKSLKSHHTLTHNNNELCCLKIFIKFFIYVVYHKNILQPSIWTKWATVLFHIFEYYISLCVLFRCENILLRIAFFRCFSRFSSNVWSKVKLKCGCSAFITGAQQTRPDLAFARSFLQNQTSTPIYLLNEMVFSFYYDDVGYIINFLIWFNI